MQTRQVTSEDAAFILSKVPQATDPQAAVFNVEASLEELAISDIPPSSTPTNALIKQSQSQSQSQGQLQPQPHSQPQVQVQVVPNNGPLAAVPYTEPPQTRRPVPKVPVAPTFKAQALWEYNIDNEVSTPHYVGWRLLVLLSIAYLDHAVCRMPLRPAVTAPLPFAIR